MAKIHIDEIPDLEIDVGSGELGSSDSVLDIATWVAVMAVIIG